MLLPLNQSAYFYCTHSVRFRQIAEQDLKQSRAIFEHSMSLAERTVSNTLDCGFKMARLREPQEFVQVQTDFLSRQAQACADQAKELNERLVKEAEELTNAFVDAHGLH